MSDSTEATVAAGATEMLGVVDYPETPIAWSQVGGDDHWRMPRRQVRKVMWVALPVLVAAGAVLAFTLGRSQTTAAVIAQPPVTTHPIVAIQPPPLPPPPISTDDQFVQAMVQNHFQVADRAAVIKAAHIICANLLDGATRDDANQHVYQAVKNSGYTYDDAVRYVDVSIRYYCPQEG